MVHATLELLLLIIHFCWSKDEEICVLKCILVLTYPYEYKYKHGDKVICTRDRVFIGQTEQVHNGGAHAQYTLDLVSGSLVGINGPYLGLCRGPGSLLKVNLKEE